MTDIHTWNKTDSSNTSSPPAGAPEGMLPSSVNDVLRAVMGANARRYADTNGSLTTGGSSNAYTLTPNDTYSAYADGMAFVAEANHSNTGATTLNVSSLGAKSVVLPNGNALVGGEIISGGRYAFSYDGTNFQLLNPSAKDRTLAHKSANQTTGTGMSDDNHLLATVAANSLYLVELTLYMTIADTTNTSDVVIEFSAPSGTTVTGAEPGSALVVMTSLDYTASVTTSTGVIQLTAFAETSGTGGTLQLRMSQNGSVVIYGANTVRKGSVMAVTKLA